MKYIVTDAAVFIGNFPSERLCVAGHEVIGLDNLNDYYDPNLKLVSLKLLDKFTNFSFIELDLADRDGIASLFSEEKFDCVIQLAAQVGVHYSIENPMAYIDSNFEGIATILEGCCYNKVKPHTKFLTSVQETVCIN